MRTTSNRELARQIGVSETAVRRAEWHQVNEAGGLPIVGARRQSVTAP